LRSGWPRVRWGERRASRIPTPPFSSITAGGDSDDEAALEIAA
jgi:hypothetical protein